MKNNSTIVKNLKYQTIYQILITALPLITAPYLARVLGVRMQGIYSYTNSIVCYFTLFAMLGITNHGTRTIAKVRDNIEERSKSFFAIYIIQIISCIMTFLLYSLYLLTICNENRNIAVIQLLAIISCFVDTNWFFMGMENFKFIVTRNIIIKVISVILILLLVKKPDDLWIYTTIMVGSTFMSNIITIRRLLKSIVLKLPSRQEVTKEVKPVLILFIPLLAMSLYHIMDKTMLGILSNYENVGFYYNADKIINIPIGIVTGISTVLFPRGVAVLNSKSNKEFENLFIKSLEGTIIVSIVLTFGISAISKDFVPLFFGKGFEPCINLIIFLSPVMIIKSISSIVRYQYLIPKNEEKHFVVSVIIGAISNFFANLFLIPKYGAYGAVFGTLIAELIACVIQIILILKEINVFSIIMKYYFYFIDGIIMWSVVKVAATYLNIFSIAKIFTEIILGGIIFVSILILYWKTTKNRLFYELIKKETIIP